MGSFQSPDAKNSRANEIDVAYGRGLHPAVVWRWHFYAGLLCIPFVVLLSITGCLYLFKPQIDAGLERNYDQRAASGSTPADRLAVTPSRQVAAALAAVPGSRLQAYELPRSPETAVRVLLTRDRQVYRVFLDPARAEVLGVVPEEQRLTRVLSRLHGELLLGRSGSMLVELAASWAIVMIVSGLYLWWPRHGDGLAGVLYPRWQRNGRGGWRDLHAVVGSWVALFTLFLLISGLPWAASWGSLLKSVRQLAAPAPLQQDWPIGGRSAVPERTPAHHPAATDGVAASSGAGTPSGAATYDAAALDRVVGAALPLQLAPPVLVQPASQPGHWLVKSDAQNRPRRETVEIDAATGTPIARVPFAQRPWLDRVIGYAVAAHEGQLFGWLNVALGVFTAAGLLLVSLSGLWIWLLRRPAGRLGAPAARPSVRLSGATTLATLGLGILLPFLGLSLLAVLAVDRWLVPRWPWAAAFLGHSAARPASG